MHLTDKDVAYLVETAQVTPIVAKDSRLAVVVYTDWTYDPDYPTVVAALIDLDSGQAIFDWETSDRVEVKDGRP